jgi:hypothetical protein
MLRLHRPLAFRATTIAVLACAALGWHRPAGAFGDVAHQAIALVAQAHLDPRAAREIERLLALDRDAFTMRDGGSTSDSFARQSTWADYHRESQRALGKPPNEIHGASWHFVNIELRGGALDAACSGFPRLGAGARASDGPDPDCIVNKIEQFAAELASPSVPDDEKLLALKWLLHLVGDLHQPLHVSDDFDRGGNAKSASVAGGIPAPLHLHWDTTFVEAIGATGAARTTHPRRVVAALPEPSAADRARWLDKPQVRAWALESFAIAKAHAYGRLPPPERAGDGVVYRLDASYAENAARIVAEQIGKGGYRLAALLNDALATRATAAR